MENPELNYSSLKKEDILALDIATRTGYYSVHEQGTWNFTESKRRNNNKLHKHFRDTLMEFIVSHDIKQVVAEDVNVNNFFTDIRRLSELRGILFEICDELNLPEPYFINVRTLKKWATGNANAKKNDMMQACVIRYGFYPQDDNVSDACHLFHYYTRKYRITAPLNPPEGGNWS